MAKSKTYYCTVQKTIGQNTEETAFRIHDAAGSLPQELVFSSLPTRITCDDDGNVVHTALPREPWNRERAIGPVHIGVYIAEAPNRGGVYEREVRFDNSNACAGAIDVREGSRYMMLFDPNHLSPLGQWNIPPAKDFVLHLLRFLGVNGRV